jgi:serine/threonine-protein kinase
VAANDDLGSAPTAVSRSGVEMSVAPAPPPSVLADRYEILGLLGAGGMGRVYRAHDKTLDEIVALKMLRGELTGTVGVLDRFVQEVKLARRVTHENVVRTFDLGQHADVYFLTMELVDGRSLGQLLDDGALANDEVMRIARAAAAGIAAAHAKGVLHRDLKPDNILVGKSGRIAITDFGIATPAASPVATADRFAGTPAYMAPEQVETNAPIGPATDVYAFGAILYEMLTGQRPFPGRDIVQVALARLRVPPPDPRAIRAVPDALAELAMRCMARSPADRFADGAALSEALERPLTVATTAAPQRTPVTVPAASSRSVAILPLRASPDLSDLASGIAEEIVDTLSMTRVLRVRPLASVRKEAAADTDARSLGTTLGVDILVEGSVRRRGELVRISARVIGVADGFQLWANHFDARPDAILEASDAVVQAVARALTVELAVPARQALDGRAAELYLAGKARLRAGWVGASVETALAELEEAYQLAPDDPAVAATLATALARAAFMRGGDDKLARSRALAERATAAAPALAEAWFARGVACLYSGEVAQASVALVQACAHAPGFAMAQGMLGGILLEAGAIEGALRHLEAADSLDPLGIAHFDLPRAYVYEGRWDDAMHQLEGAREATHSNMFVFDAISLARFQMWRGEKVTLVIPAPERMTPRIREFAEISARVHATATFPAADRARMGELALADTLRMRATLSQFMAEFLLFAGDPDEALRWIQISCDSGLQDRMWFERCPMLAPLRSRPEFQAAQAAVVERAEAVVSAAMQAVGKLG